MNRAASWYTVGLVVAIAVLVGGLVYVEVRSRNPEWVPFQEKGIALAVQRLQGELDAGAPPDKKAAILTQIATLKRRKPEVIEISPFGGKLAPERCLTCHFGIEDVSTSHPNSVFGCVCCHGGNGPDLTVQGAHIGLRGGRNPARLDLASLSCGSARSEMGKCHSEREHPLLNRADNVPRSIMATNAGIIGILRFQWGIEPNSDTAYAVKPVADGEIRLGEVPPEHSAQGSFRLADSHFRKFCASCHLWTDRHEDRIGRLAGCPACHAAYAPDGRYSGGDPTVNRTEAGHAKTHTITNRIENDRCRACHNRSARIGLNYRGEMENEQYGTPFVRGGLNDRTLGDDRFYTQLVPDAHHEKGMACIDCHTGQDTMGDGRIHRFMKDQVEIRCEDCHGGYTEPPRTMKVDTYNPLVQTLIRTAGFGKPQEGDTILETSKGRPLVNIRMTAKGFKLTGKLTGKEHPVSVVTGKKNGHTIKGHERLECDTCHSAWSPQCYGCHQELDFGHQAKDWLSGKTTAGRWTEGRTYFRFERNIYGINSRGRVGILVPGCQVWNSVIESDGKVVSGYDSRVMKLRNGLNSIAMGPTHPHTTRTQVPRCVECHLDPKALGLGEGTQRLTDRSDSLAVNTLYDSQASGLKIPFALDAVVNAKGDILQGTSHKLARGFNGEEIKKIVAITPCLPCHDRYDDPVWSKPGPYKETPKCLEALEKMKKD